MTVRQSTHRTDFEKDLLAAAAPVLAQSGRTPAKSKTGVPLIQHARLGLHPAAR
jgi:hypothetical protein